MTLAMLPRVVMAPALALVVACGATGTAGSGGSTPDPLNATFKIEGSSVTVVNGRAEREAAPGSASKAVITVNDRRAVGDVDGDGRSDVVVVLTQQPGGSGTFYYVAVLLNPASGVASAPAVMLGDRIAVNAVRIDGRAIVVDLLDRASGQPLTASPSVSTTKRSVVDRGALAPQ